MERGKGACGLVRARFWSRVSLVLKALVGLSFLKGGVYPEGCAIASPGNPSAVQVDAAAFDATANQALVSRTQQSRRRDTAESRLRLDMLI